jgi:hypothetical protein
MEPNLDHELSNLENPALEPTFAGIIEEFGMLVLKSHKFKTKARTSRLINYLGN